MASIGGTGGANTPGAMMIASTRTEGGKNVYAKDSRMAGGHFAVSLRQQERINLKRDVATAAAAMRLGYSNNR